MSIKSHLRFQDLLWLAAFVAIMLAAFGAYWLATTKRPNQKGNAKLDRLMAIDSDRL
jgi:hypothetical protein